MGLLVILLPLLSKVLENLFPDPAARAAAQLQMQEAINQATAMQLDAEAKATVAQAQVVTAEVSGQSAMQRNWRPMLMYLFMVIILNNYILFPLLHAMFPSMVVLAVPEQMWSLIEICVGGYVGGRSLEKIATTAFDNTKFFNTLRQKMGSLSPAQVQAMNAAISAAEE